MTESISKRNEAKASMEKLLGKPTPRDTSLGIELAIHFYSLEDGDQTEEGEEAEKSILFRVEA